MAWAEIILYINQSDVDRIREWLNDEECVAWIIADSRSGTTYRWKTVDRLDTVRPQTYAIWHKESGALTIPSGCLDVADTTVLDPYEGWTQELETTEKTSPWFGANLPGPYSFRFKEQGNESSGSLGRSGFGWAGDHFRLIGKPANPEAKKWWQRLKRFIRSNSTPVPWPDVGGSGKAGAYMFEGAYGEMKQGRPVDAIP